MSERRSDAEYDEEMQRLAVELDSSEDRFRLLVESTRDYAIFMLDPEGRIASWNPGAERLKG
jgi:PAS domain-containing protein